MKGIIVYAVLFLFTFIIVSLGMYQANNKYENLFHFDLRDRFALALEKKSQDSVKAFQDSVKQKIEQDSITKSKNRDTTLTAEAAHGDVAKTEAVEKNTAGKNEEQGKPLAGSIIDPVKNKMQAEKDSARVIWKRKTIKVYESMDSKQLAKIIPDLENDLARDLIYSMKDKKRGEVLGLLSKEVVLRLTRQ